MCRGVTTRLDGAWGYKFGVPMFEPEVFRKQMYCSAKSAYDIAVTSPPRSDSAPGELCPLAPLVTSLVSCNKNRKIF